MTHQIPGLSEANGDEMVAAHPFTTASIAKSKKPVYGPQLEREDDLSEAVWGDWDPVPTTIPRRPQPTAFGRRRLKSNIEDLRKEFAK